MVCRNSFTVNGVTYGWNVEKSTAYCVKATPETGVPKSCALKLMSVPGG